MLTAYFVTFLMIITLVFSLLIEKGRGFWNIVHQGNTWVMQAVTMILLSWLNYDFQKTNYDLARDTYQASQEILYLLKPTLNYFSKESFLLLYAIGILFLYMLLALIETNFSTEPSDKLSKYIDKEGIRPTRSYICWILISLFLGWASVNSFLYFNALSSGIAPAEFLSQAWIPTLIIIGLICFGAWWHNHTWGTLAEPSFDASSNKASEKPLVIIQESKELKNEPK
jgi:hypothetical protein